MARLDPARRQQLGIPADLKFKTKVELAWDGIQKIIGQGLPFEIVGFDSLYGRSGWLREQLREAGKVYLAEVPADTQVYLEKPPLGIPERKSKRGRKPTRVQVLSGKAQQAGNCWRVPDLREHNCAPERTIRPRTEQRRRVMRTYFNRFGILGVVVLINFYGCATTPPLGEAQKTQEALLSRASYEQIRPTIEKIQVGDARSKVLEIAKPKKEVGQYFKTTKAGQVKALFFHNWPGVLTPKVSSIIDVPDPRRLLKESGVVVKETDPLAHFRKDAYEDLFLKKKDQIVPGMHLWEVFTLLGANYIMTADAQGFVVMCPGFLNYKGAVKLDETADGVRAIYPFGYLEGDTEIVKWEVEMLNYRVVRVRPRGG